MTAVATGEVDIVPVDDLHTPRVILRTELLHTRFRVQAGDAAEVVSEGVQGCDGVVHLVEDIPM